MTAEQEKKIVDGFYRYLDYINNNGYDEIIDVLEQSERGVAFSLHGHNGETYQLEAFLLEETGEVCIENENGDSVFSLMDDITSEEMFYIKTGERVIEESEEVSLQKRADELRKEIALLRKQMEICAYSGEDLRRLSSLEEELEELEEFLEEEGLEGSECLAEDASRNPVVPRGAIEALIRAYQGNEEALSEIEEYIKRYGSLGRGITHAGDSFEAGYRNALRYAFTVLGVEDYERKEPNLDDMER